jgi:acetyl esterase/lipase
MKTIATLSILLLSASLLHGQRGGIDREKLEHWKAMYGKMRSAKTAATEADIAYGKHQRNKLDLWKAKSRKPTPVLVYFHGGGFRFGDKKMIHAHIPIEDYLDKGVSCISVNYPFLQHTNDDLGKIVAHGEDALEFIVANATKWNIDPTRISLAGSSAGAMISQRLGHTTRDVNSLAAFNQPMKTEKTILPYIKKTSPPIIIYHENDLNDEMHPPEAAKMVKEAYEKKRLECHLYGTGENTIEKIPDGKTPEVAVLDFFLGQWGLD